MQEFIDQAAAHTAFAGTIAIAPLIFAIPAAWFFLSQYPALKSKFQSLHQCLDTCSILQQIGDSLLEQLEDLQDELSDEIEIACMLECIDCDGL